MYEERWEMTWRNLPPTLHGLLVYLQQEGLRWTVEEKDAWTLLFLRAVKRYYPTRDEVLHD